MNANIGVKKVIIDNKDCKFNINNNVNNIISRAKYNIPISGVQEEKRVFCKEDVKYYAIIAFVEQYYLRRKVAESQIKVSRSDIFRSINEVLENNDSTKIRDYFNIKGLRTQVTKKIVTFICFLRLINIILSCQN